VKNMASGTQDKASESCLSTKKFMEGGIVRIGASTSGMAVVGGAVGSFFGPVGSGIGAVVGGAIGLAASASEVMNSTKDK
jgi:hypothetical protein